MKERTYEQVLAQLDGGSPLAAQARKQASRGDSAVPHPVQRSVEMPQVDRQLEVGSSLAMHAS